VAGNPGDTGRREASAAILGSQPDRVLRYRISVSEEAALREITASSLTGVEHDVLACWAVF
jgi:hypothetical protein